MAKLGRLTVSSKNGTKIMGIINTSPESFYKNSVKITKSEISKTAKKMEEDGADIIDIGAMSTAPYLKTVISEKQELNRISKSIGIIQNTTNLPISIDTCRASVAEYALTEGVEIVNDVSGLKFDTNMPKVLEKFQPSVIVCAYSKKIMNNGCVAETKKLLQESIKIARNAKIPRDKIVVDPAIGFFRKSGSGFPFTKIRSDWVARDISVIQNALVSIPVALLRQSITLIGAMAIILYLNWKLTGLILLILPPLMLFARVFGIRLRLFAEKLQDQIARAVIVLEEVASSIKIVKSFTREPYERERFEKEIESAFERAVDKLKISSFFGPFILGLTFLVSAVLIWYGGYQVMSGTTTPGELAAFFLYALIVAGPIGTFIRLYTQIQEKHIQKPYLRLIQEQRTEKSS